ncbi:hypothetical protein ABT297_33960 [Dactylosporangium sp. NPDC000555]|uniref:hypothetical protein n=1 Tax=Dactylosporangium sp. NPDC000555 TaxID=3154260 RepID=UPI0033210804
MFAFRRRSQPKKDRVGHFLFRIFGPATVEGAIQGWSPEAREQYKRLRENQKRAAEERRRAREP